MAKEWDRTRAAAYNFRKVNVMLLCWCWIVYIFLSYFTESNISQTFDKFFPFFCLFFVSLCATAPKKFDEVKSWNSTFVPQCAFFLRSSAEKGNKKKINKFFWISLAFYNISSIYTVTIYAHTHRYTLPGNRIWNKLVDEKWP